jgi:hypothetical protein
MVLNEHVVESVEVLVTDLSRSCPWQEPNKRGDMITQAS